MSDLDRSWPGLVRSGESAVRIPVSQSYVHTGMDSGKAQGRGQRNKTNYEGTVDIKYQHFEL